VANVEAGYGSDKWIGGVKVTSLEKAPASDYKALGIRDDAGTVYYLRFDVTHVSGTTTYPPNGSEVSHLKPLFTQGQRVSSINVMHYPKCTTFVYKADGTMDSDKQKLEIGETATNMCQPFVVDKGTLTQVVHTFYDVKKNEDQFSVQVMDTRERIQGYLREDMRSVSNEKKSAMPVFGPDKLSDADLDDLLAYLESLQGTSQAPSNAR